MTGLVRYIHSGMKVESVRSFPPAFWIPRIKNPAMPSGVRLILLVVGGAAG